MKQRVIIAILLGLFFCCPNAKASASYEVTSVTGAANHIMDGGNTQLDLRAGDELRVNEEIKAASGVTVNLVSDNTDLILRPLSHIRMDASGLLILVEGELLSGIRKVSPNTPFAIHTSVASLSASQNAVFRTLHRHGQTTVIVSGGTVETTTLDPSGSPRSDARALTTGQRALIDESGFLNRNSADDTASGPSAVPGGSGGSGGSGVTIEASNKAYYIIPSCNVADNIGSCAKRKTPQTWTKPEDQYDDFAIYVGDSSPLPTRAMLPWSESLLQFSILDTTYRFRGAMILCADYDGQSGQIRIKLFQAETDVQVSYRDGKTEIEFVSRNQSGIHNTEVNVNEGEVAVTTPWLCESCFAEKTFLVEALECYEFKHNPEPAEEDIELPKIVIDPPPAMDTIKKPLT